MYRFKNAILNRLKYLIEANPHKFTSRWFNLLQYAEAGSKDIIKKTWRDLKDYIELEVKKCSSFVFIFFF